jgi:hypothetical protein
MECWQKALFNGFIVLMNAMFGSNIPLLDMTSC